MATFLTTAQKRKAKAEADFIASLAPRGAARKAALPQRASSQQVWLMYSDAERARLHRRDCWVVAKLEGAGRGWKARLATDEELATHGGCAHCA
jgi:hypothetical protein